MHARAFVVSVDDQRKERLLGGMQGIRSVFRNPRWSGDFIHRSVDRWPPGIVHGGSNQGSVAFQDRHNMIE